MAGPGGAAVTMLGVHISFDLSGNGDSAVLVGRFEVTPAPAVPEPSSLALCGLTGLSGLGFAGWRRKRAA